MAINTVPDPIRLVDTKVFSFYRYPVPECVAVMDRQRDVINDCDVIRWKVRGSDTIHSMEMFVVTDETITAVLAAMRLSC